LILESGASNINIIAIISIKLPTASPVTTPSELWLEYDIFFTDSYKQKAVSEQPAIQRRASLQAGHSSKHTTFTTTFP
jgi:hypothetical protein